jgi:CubicO group peptidase (beta-lactamase class C family)
MKVCREATAAGLQLVGQERAMTIRDLLMHTSGIPAGVPDGSPVEQLYHRAELTRPDRTLGEMVQILGELPLVHQPGGAWRYGLSHEVLGRLVEVVAGMPFDAFLDQRIFKPLGMQDMDFYAPPEKHARLAAVYGPAESGGLCAWPRPKSTNTPSRAGFSPGAGVSSPRRLIICALPRCCSMAGRWMVCAF